MIKLPPQDELVNFFFISDEKSKKNKEKDFVIHGFAKKNIWWTSFVFQFLILASFFSFKWKTEEVKFGKKWIKLLLEN